MGEGGPIAMIFVERGGYSARMERAGRRGAFRCSPAALMKEGAREMKTGQPGRLPLRKKRKERYSEMVRAGVELTEVHRQE